MTVYATSFANLQTLTEEAERSLFPEILFVEAEDELDALFIRLQHEGFEGMDPGFCGDTPDQVMLYLLTNYDVVVNAKAAQLEADVLEEADDS